MDEVYGAHTKLGWKLKDFLGEKVVSRSKSQVFIDLPTCSQNLTQPCKETKLNTTMQGKRDTHMTSSNILNPITKIQLQRCYEKYYIIVSNLWKQQNL